MSEIGDLISYGLFCAKRALSRRSHLVYPDDVELWQEHLRVGAPDEEDLRITAELLEDKALETAWSVGYDSGATKWECSENAKKAEDREKRTLLVWRRKHGMSSELLNPLATPARMGS